VTGWWAANTVHGARHRDTNMCKSDEVNLQNYSQYITTALRTKGGHLSVGRGGYA